jgi:osmotically-inducible protein OsmY
MNASSKSSSNIQTAAPAGGPCNETTMWNKEEVAGKRKQIEGAINLCAGKLIHDPNLEAVGALQRREGQAQQQVGQARRKAAAATKEVNKVSTWLGVTGLLTLTLLSNSAVLSGCASADSRPALPNPTPSQMSKVALEEKIKAKFDTDVRLSAANLVVEANVKRNAVTLTGRVESAALQAKAIAWAKSAQPGLIVTTKIDVRPLEFSRTAYTSKRADQERLRAQELGETVGASLDDAWIHYKIVAELTGNSAVPEHEIKVDVTDNAVTLRGLVETSVQKTAAERVAQNTEGVKHVSNQLKVGGTPGKQS